MTALVNDLVNVIATYASWESTFRLCTISEHLTRPLYDKNNSIWHYKLEAEYANVLPDRDNLDWLTFYWKITQNHYGERHVISLTDEKVLGEGYSTVYTNYLIDKHRDKSKVTDTRTLHVVGVSGSGDLAHRIYKRGNFVGV